MTQEKGHPDEQWMQNIEEAVEVILSRSKEPTAKKSNVEALQMRRQIRAYRAALRRYAETPDEMSMEVMVRQKEKLTDLARIMTAETAVQKTWADALEERAAVERRLRRFKVPDPTEPGIVKWLAVPIAQIFLSEDQREEWLGDLREENRKLMRDDCSMWMLNIINIGKIARLFKSSIAVNIIDFILKLQGKV
ncbi:hypothetical protein NDA01_21705 [Trichocoleus desertorum AS-A10]|uniref:hypothetical protein n=1 Tax=Trichocoleus desertorum TaxID=1481672 RepID=UPI00329A2E33